MDKKLELGNRLKVIRAEKDMSQEDLAKLVGASRQTIGAIESKSFNPSAKLAMLLCMVLNKKFEEIFYLEVK